MKTAEEKSSYYIWFVLNKIMEKALPGRLGEVSYTFNIDITRTNPISFTNERNALSYLLKSNVIKKVGEDVLAEGGEKGTSSYYVEEIYRLGIKKKFYDYYDYYRKIQNVTQNYCWFDNNTFFLTLRDSSVKAISFDTERSSRQVLALFQTIIEHWKKNGDKPITGSEIVKAMAGFGSKVDATQLKNIISNVRNKKIKPAGLEDKIHIEYDRKADGWRTDIKR